MAKILTGRDICRRAAEYEGDKYWYGGKHQLATRALADQLRRENPSNWTDAYYAKALKDCDGKTYVCDCSGLVCHAYDIGDISSYGLRDRYPRWTGAPKDGMILWRTGHVGLYDNGKVRELKGIDYDYCFNAYVKSQWSEIHYDPNINYDGVKIGWTKIGDGWKYSADGKDYLISCWREINRHWYYFGTDGVAYTGIHKIGSETFYFATTKESVDLECAMMETNDRGALVINDIENG